MNPYYKQYLQYIYNTGGQATSKDFICDWEPIGKMVWHDLITQNLAEVQDGKIRLTEDGEKERSG